MIPFFFLKKRSTSPTTKISASRNGNNGREEKGSGEDLSREAKLDRIIQNLQQQQHQVQLVPSSHPLLSLSLCFSSQRDGSQWMIDYEMMNRKNIFAQATYQKKALDDQCIKEEGEKEEGEGGEEEEEEQEMIIRWLSIEWDPTRPPPPLFTSVAPTSNNDNNSNHHNILEDESRPQNTSGEYDEGEPTNLDSDNQKTKRMDEHSAKHVRLVRSTCDMLDEYHRHAEDILDYYRRAKARKHLHPSASFFSSASASSTSASAMLNNHPSFVNGMTSSRSFVPAGTIGTDLAAITNPTNLTATTDPITPTITTYTNPAPTMTTTMAAAGMTGMSGIERRSGRGSYDPNRDPRLRLKSLP